MPFFRLAQILGLKGGSVNQANGYFALASRATPRSTKRLTV